MTDTTLVADVPTYPKIKTLFVRNPETFKVTTELKCLEFGAVKHWHITEKIDGTNIRVALLPDNRMFIGGRSNNAQIPPRLMEYLTNTFSAEMLIEGLRRDADKPLIVLYGEGYGAKIQKGGGNYRADSSFRLFDVQIGEVWLEQDTVRDVADQLGIKAVPVFPATTLEYAMEHYLPSPSKVAIEDGGPGCVHEGVVARSAPLMLDRMGRRIIWKLKGKDF